MTAMIRAMAVAWALAPALTVQSAAGATMPYPPDADFYFGSAAGSYTQINGTA